VSPGFLLINQVGDRLPDFLIQCSGLKNLILPRIGIEADIEEVTISEITTDRGNSLIN
jgi:hypothetical protein